MEIERRVLKSTSILLSAGVLSQLLNFAFVTLFARAYSPEVFGEYSFALSLGAMIGIFVSLGANRLLLRKCSEDPGQWLSHVGLLLPAQVILATGLCIATIVVGRWLSVDESALRIIVITSSLQLITPVWGLMAIGFSATERMSYAALAELGIRLLILLVGGVAMLANARPELTLSVLPASGIVAGLVLFRIAGAEFGRPRLRVDFSSLVAIWREAMPFFGILALTIIYARTGLVFLRALGGPEEVAVFAPAERLVMAAGVFHMTFGGAIFPALVRLSQSDLEQFRQLANRCMRVTLLISLPAASVLFLFADDLILMLFGETYRPSGQVLAIVAWLLALRAASLNLNHIAVAADQRALILIANGVALACLLLLCVTIVPAMGARGLAISLVVSQAVKIVIVIVGLARKGLLPSMLEPSVRVASACIVTIAAAYFAADQSLWLRALFVTVLGVSLLWVFRAVRWPDVVFFRQISLYRSPKQAPPGGS